MMKIINLLFFVSLLAGLAACYDDKGNFDYTDLPEISIKTKDVVYATQYKTLNLSAEVEGVSEGDYEYSWRIWSNDIGGVDKQKVIGNAKDLVYEVSDIPGAYTLLLTVKNKITEVKTFKEIRLTVQGSITEGWMVLQEKDGKTDFDLIMSPYFSNRVEQDEILHDVYEMANGETLEGRGVRIASFFSIGRYQDVIVLTDKGGARLSAMTMQKKYDMDMLWRDMDSYKPENYLFWDYLYGPGRMGFDAIISDGRFYLYNILASQKFPVYTEPVLKDITTYKASPWAPKRFVEYRFSGILYDEIGGRFLSIDNNLWTLQEMPFEKEGMLFDLSNMHASLHYMDVGYENYEYALFEDWTTHELTLYAINFNNTPKPIAVYPADQCPELSNAKYYAVGALGPVFYYATDREVYRFDYKGTKVGEKLYTLANADEKITGMKIFKPCVDYFIPSHPYNNKVLILSTYDESRRTGKVYMYYVNEVTGAIDLSSEKVFDGFGEILDMEYNIPKYGS